MERNPITLKPLVYSMDGVDAIAVRRDLPFVAADGGELLMDLYSPPGAGPAPVVLIVEGYNDAGAERILGCRFKDMVCIDGWARLMAASGMAVVVGTNRSPLADARALLAHVRQNARALGVDASRIGLWACSGHGPVALSALMSDRGLRCAALLYTYTLDLGASTFVAEAQKMFRFENPGGGKSVDDLPVDVPMFLARAGKDDPGLNAALDQFVAGALLRNLPISLVNHPTGPHAFDLMDDSRMSREIIEQTLSFLRFHLEITQ